MALVRLGEEIERTKVPSRRLRCQSFVEIGDGSLFAVSIATHEVQHQVRKKHFLG